MPAEGPPRHYLRIIRSNIRGMTTSYQKDKIVPPSRKPELKPQTSPSKAPTPNNTQSSTRIYKGHDLRGG
jgi:hypothetical protein